MNISDKHLKDIVVSEITRLIKDNHNQEQIIKTIRKEYGSYVKSRPAALLLYKEAINRIKKIYEVPVKDIRSQYLLKLENDINSCYKKYLQYEQYAQDNSNLAYVSLQWFDKYLKLKRELLDFYPGVIPTEREDKEQTKWLIMKDDGVDDEEPIPQEDDEEEN